MGVSMGSWESNNNGVWCVLLVGLLLVAVVEGDDCKDFCKRMFVDKDRYDVCIYGCSWSLDLHLKPSAGEARGAEGRLTAPMTCDKYCRDLYPDTDRRYCVQNLCPFNLAKLTSKSDDDDNKRKRHYISMAVKGQKMESYSCDDYCSEEEPDVEHEYCVYRCETAPRRRASTTAGHVHLHLQGSLESAQKEEKESLALTGDEKNLKVLPTCYYFCERFNDTPACYDDCDRHPGSALPAKKRG